MKFFVFGIFVLSLCPGAKIFAQCRPAFSFVQETSSRIHFSNIHLAMEDSTTTYLWTFGDGDSSLAQNPIHTFADTGWFNVCLYVHISGINCSSDTCMSVHIVNCQAYFTWVYDPTFEQPEASVFFFTDSSQGEDHTVIYSWTFGGNDLGGGKNPSWTFDIDDAGDQAVCLTILNRDNSCISTYCDTVNINPLLCPADSFAYTRQGTAYTFYPWTCGYFHHVTWDFGDGTIDSTNSISDSVVHNYPSATDTYYVCLTIGYDSLCQYYKPCTAVYCHAISAANTGINEASIDGELFTVYPNPVDKTMIISLSGLAISVTLEIYDVTGRKIKHFALADKVTELDVAELSSGVYILEFNDAAGTRAAAKLVKD